ncbi:hypothetical protein AB0N28_03475 [Streptomyces sp. NPDC051130]|uniref:hypothetical protein n=1 Tax=Streptomyces sp. NPDC051130 TaxID=3157223 RepID=UPI00341983A7
MQYEEHYLVTTVARSGAVINQQIEDPAEAHGVFEDERRMLAKGSRVELRRFTSVVLSTGAKA